jgi:hypothetical protein
MGRGLPQGRGLRTDVQQFVTQGESDALRAGLLPSLTAWLISPVGEAINANSCGQVCFTANRLYLFHIPSATGVVQVNEARLRVISNLAASSVSAALYQYDFINRRLVKMAGSEANFATTAIGRVTGNVKLDVQPSARLFLGFWASHLAVEVEGFCSGITGRCFDNFYVPWTSSSLPASLPLSTLTVDTEANTPMVLYLSKEAATVL